MEIASIIASIISVFLGGFAIWLSITFYRLSNQTSQETKEAARTIFSNVERMEIIIDKLYSDTFGIMKDTVSDMRKHIWPQGQATLYKITEEVNKTTEQKISKLKEDLLNEFKEYLTQQKLNEDKINALSIEVRGLVDKAVARSKEAKEEGKKAHAKAIVVRLLHLNKTVHAIKLVNYLLKYGFEHEDAVYILKDFLV
jgi:hypothetical protein